ncbi:MAG: plasmid stabilization protein [Methylophaga sp.]|nr:MAG: plasmid stabilization protein [Methylophaga sp.]
MASITIRNLDESVKAKLRIVAANHGHSMEEEARTILRNTLNAETISDKGLGQKIHQRFMLANVEMPELSKRSDLPRAAELDI